MLKAWAIIVVLVSLWAEDAASAPACVADKNAKPGVVKTITGPFTLHKGQGQPFGVAVSPDGETLYITNEPSQVGSIEVKTGKWKKIAGSDKNVPRSGADGTGAAAKFKYPQGVALTKDGKKLYVAGGSDHAIRVVEVATGIVKTLSGKLNTKGSARAVAGKAARFNIPADVALSPDEKTLYVPELVGKRICTVDTKTGAKKIIAKTGGKPSGIAVSPDGKTLYVGGYSVPTITEINVATHAQKIVAGGGKGSADGKGKAAKFYYPTGVATSPDGSKLYVVECDNNLIRVIDLATKEVKLLAGSAPGGSETGKAGFKDGVGKKAMFKCPRFGAVSPDGKYLYVGDQKNNRVRSVSTGLVCGGAGAGAKGGGKMKWRIINYNCKCAKSKFLKASKSSAACLAALDSRKATYGFWDETSARCFSATGCDICMTSSSRVIVYSKGAAGAREL